MKSTPKSIKRETDKIHKTLKELQVRLKVIQQKCPHDNVKRKYDCFALDDYGCNLKFIYDCKCQSCRKTWEEPAPDDGRQR